MTVSVDTKFTSERHRLVIPGLAPYCSEFLSTYVDREGTMKGTNLAWFRKLRRLTSMPITAAGGIRSRAEVRGLEELGIMQPRVWCSTGEDFDKERTDLCELNARPYK
ncbi:MAG: HisA/HisF-related TIM barrel protein [Candidatus Acidiferrales bacterium]